MFRAFRSEGSRTTLDVLGAPIRGAWNILRRTRVLPRLAKRVGGRGELQRTARTTALPQLPILRHCVACLATPGMLPTTASAWFCVWAMGDGAGPPLAPEASARAPAQQEKTPHV